MSYLTSLKLSPVGNIIEDTYHDIHIVNTLNFMPSSFFGKSGLQVPEAWCCLCCWDVSVRCRKKIGNISSYQKKVRNPLVVSENTLETELNNYFCVQMY